MASSYDNYYSSQAFGTPAGDLGPYFISSYPIQSGRGLGNILGSIFRWFSPIIKKGAKNFAQESLKTGSSILTDLTNRTSGGVGGESRPISEIIKSRVKEGTDRLQKTLLSGSGLGFKRQRRTACPQSSAKRAKLVTVKKATKKRKNKQRKKLVGPRDIFNNS